MDFKETTEELMAGVTRVEIAQALGVSLATVAQARLEPSAKAYRNPPAGWEPKLAKLAKRGAERLTRIVERLQPAPRPEARASMAIFVIRYDLHPTRGETYNGLIETIKSLGDWWHCLDSTWLLQCTLTAMHLHDTLWQHMQSGDQLLVLKYDPPHSAWVGFGDDYQTWLQNHM